MRTQLLGPLALLMPPTLANPLYRYYFPRQASSSTISLTSTGTLTAQPNDATQATEPCIATHLASASTTCEDVASQYGIQLSTTDAQSLASSDDCKFALQGYRLCIRTDGSKTADTFPTLPATTLQGLQNGTTSATLAPAAETSSITSSVMSETSSLTESSTTPIAALATGTLATHLTTFTFTQGVGASASVRELVVTKIGTESSSSSATSGSVDIVQATTATSSSSDSSSVAAATTTAESSSGDTTSVEAATTTAPIDTTASSSIPVGTAPASDASSSSEASLVTMFSVSANVVTQSTTMTNSYVDGAITHVNEVIVMHVTTDYSTFFSTKTDVAQINVAATETSSSSVETTSTAVVESSNSTVALASSVEPTTPTALDLTATTTSSTMSSTSSPSVSAASAIAADCTTVAAPAPTQAGIVAGCAKWHTVAIGETCNGVAEQNGITADELYKWNTAIDSTCSNLWAGNAYCVQACEQPALAGNIASNSTRMSNSTSTTASTSASTLLPTLTPNAKNGSATDVYKTYLGDGSAAAGWPSMAKWVDFDTMFAQNTPNMKSSCKQWNVQENTDQEQEYLKSAILSESQATGIDPRFILAVTLQESTGCVRVITTAYAVPNPGLMQSHNGTGTCNPMNTHPGLPGATTQAIKVTDPCPQTEINQMIKDGVSGTASGDGLLQVLIKQGSTDDVTKWYRAARLYNGGEIAASGDLGQGCCTACYASDVANRLTGWVDAPSTCTLTLTAAAAKS